MSDKEIQDYFNEQREARLQREQRRDDATAERKLREQTIRQKARAKIDTVVLPYLNRHVAFLAGNNTKIHIEESVESGDIFNVRFKLTESYRKEVPGGTRTYNGESSWYLIRVSAFVDFSKLVPERQNLIRTTVPGLNNHFDLDDLDEGLLSKIFMVAIKDLQSADQSR